MAIERINLRLDTSIQSEREFLEAYASISRSRRQEWLRSLIRAGMAATSNSQTIVVPQPVSHVAASVTSSALDVASMAGQATQTKVIAPPKQGAPAPARVAQAPAVAPHEAAASLEAGPASSVAQPQSTPAVVKPKAAKGSASVLKGFLPESGLLPESGATSALS